MKFPFTKLVTKVVALCSTDQRHPLLEHPYFDAELSELQATDSYAAVRIPVTAEKGDVSRFLDRATVDDARKQKAESLPAPKPKKGEVVDGSFPNLAKLWPTKLGFTVGLDVKLLANIAGAIGTDRVMLGFQAEGAERKAILVRPLLNSGPFMGKRALDDVPKGAVALPEGLLMPILLPLEATAAQKKPAGKKNEPAGLNGDTRHDAAVKAAATRRANKEAAEAATAPKSKKGQAKVAEGDVAKALREAFKQTASKKPAAKKGATNGKSAFGKGSEARRQAALKAAQTKRERLAAAK